ncbi:MAG: thioredoxin domain-containing protein [Pseudomonadota bacterium]
MDRFSLLRLVGLAAIAPLALGLGACKDHAPTDVASPAAAAAPLPNVPPPAGKSWADVIAPTPEGGFRMGNPDAAVKIVEFGSLTCPHCAEFSEKGSATIRDTWVTSGRASFEFRHFVRDPLDITLGMLTRCGPAETYFGLTEQVFANQAAIFNGLQGKDAQMQSAMTAPDNQRFQAVAQAAGLIPFFAARGVSVDQARGCLAKPENATQMAKNTEAQSTQHDISGTPTFLFNGQKADMNTWEQVKARVESMGVR